MWPFKRSPRDTAASDLSRIRKELDELRKDTQDTLQARLQKVETELESRQFKTAYRRNLVVTGGVAAKLEKGIQHIVPPIQGTSGNDAFQIDDTFGKEVLACWMVPINSVDNYKFAHVEMYPDDTRPGGLKVRAVASKGQNAAGCLFGFYVIYR